MRLPSITRLFVLLAFLLTSACGDNIKLVSDAQILSFSINGVDGTIAGRQIIVQLPEGTDVTNLTPTITFLGASLSPPSGVAQDFTGPVIYTVTSADGTDIDYTASVMVGLSNAKAITSFVFEAADNPGLGNDVTATITGQTISATVPFGTNVTALIATFTTTGDHVQVGTAIQASGTTPNNFTNPVKYNVFAANGTNLEHTVTVTVAPSDAKLITTFNFLDADNTALTVDVIGTVGTSTISLTVPNGTIVTGLIADFTTTGANVKIGSTLQASGTTPNDFTTPVQYIVTAADNSTQVYTVTVNIAPATSKDLTSFQFLTTDNGVLSVNVNATISGNLVNATVPFGTDITALKARFTHTGASVNIGGTPQFSGVTVNNFTTVLTYTVVGADNTTQDYMVTVTNNASNSKDITSFSLPGGDTIINGSDITVTVPNGTTVTNLTPTITITGVSVSPASGAAQDFTSPVMYTVTAADNTTKPYMVTVVVAGNSSKDITRFVVNGLDAVIATTSPTTGVISLNVPNTVDLTAISPQVTITGVSVTPASGVTTNFTNDVQYVVTAGDGTMKTYTVSIDTVNGNAKVINSFTILGVAGQITNGAMNGSVTIVLPAGTDLSQQTPTIVINGSSINPPSRAPQNFNVPVMYTVTAGDGSTRVYTVTVTTQ